MMWNTHSKPEHWKEMIKAQQPALQLNSEMFSKEEEGEKADFKQGH